MFKQTMISFMLIALFISCAQKNNPYTNLEGFIGERDGSSFEKAVVLDEKTESAGINAEYAWIAKHYPDYKFEGQGLSFKDDRAYDLMNIETGDGRRITIYFDISNFYGKW